MPSHGDINFNLENLIGKIELLVDVMEKGGRANRPSSMYHYGNSESDPFLRRISSFDKVDFNRAIEDFIDTLRNKLKGLEKEIKLNDKHIKSNDREIRRRERAIARLDREIASPGFSSKPIDEQTNIQNERQKNINEQNRLINENKKLNKKQRNLRDLESRIQRKKDRFENGDDAERENSWRLEQKRKKKKLRKQYRKLPKFERELYGSEDEFVRHIVDFETYKGNTSDRNEASNMIARSGVGNTRMGRYAQTIIERNQRFADMGNFANQLQVGGASKIGKALFGNGKMGAVATGALGGFGKALGFASKALGGFANWLLIAVDIIKFIGSMVNDWKKATAEMYKHQTKQEHLQYELFKQEMLIENQMKIENVSAQGDLQLKMLEAQGATMLEALKITTGQYAKSVGIALGPLTKGINESAYDAVMSRIDAAVSAEKLGLHAGQREVQYERYGELRKLQQSGKLAGLEAERGSAQTQYTTESQRTALDTQHLLEENHAGKMLIRNMHNNMMAFDKDTGAVTVDNTVGGVNTATGERSKVITNSNESGISKSIANYNMLGANAQNFIGYGEAQRLIESAKFEYAATKLTEAAEYNKVSTDAQYQLATTEREYNTQIADKQLDLAIESKEIVIDAAAEVKKQWIQLAQSVEKYLENFDTVTNNLGINMGYTSRGQLKTFQTSMFGVVKNVSSKFGKDIDEVVKLQESFSENTGRNKIMGERDYGQLLGLGKYLGDDGLAANYASEMEIFNAGVSDSVDMLDNVLQDVNRIGLNGRKYTKTVVDNLKLAQKYQFKDGTKGLMRMAKWAENTRFNMNSLSGMLDKISEGGLEGVITQGAQFQVLGGHSAMNADPLAMMYERYADPEAFAKRMQDMTKGYGQLDTTTGETHFSGNELMMLEQLAKVQGRSVEDVQNEVRARNKREVVAKQLGGGFDEDQQSFISNNATYNKETGQFQVKVLGANGDFVNKDVNSLTKEDLSDIVPEKHEEKMEVYMQKVVSAVESMKGEEIAERADIAAATYEEMLNAYAERTRIAHETYAENRDKYIAESKQGMDEITKSFQDYIGVFKRGNEQVDASIAEINKTAKNIKSALDDTAEIIAEANAKISAASGVEYNAPTSTGKLQTTATVQAEKLKPKKVKSGDKIDANDPIAQTIIKSDNGHYTHYNEDMTWNRLGAKAYNTMISDGLLNANNQPIVAEASSVTKVQDGTSYVKSDRKDSALFAKNGGPFDKLFNNIFGKVNDIYNAIGYAKDKYYSAFGYDTENRIRKKSALEDIASYHPLYQVYRFLSDENKKRDNDNNISIESYKDTVNYPLHDTQNGVFDTPMERPLESVTIGSNQSFGGIGNVNERGIHIDPVKVEISGNLELSSDLQSIDIIEELQRNPLIIRSLSRLLTEHISSAINGGRGISRFSIGSV